MRLNLITHHCLVCYVLSNSLILVFFWQRDPHQSERMAYASQLLLPHGPDLCCVCRRHQSNQIPHHLSSSKCILFSFTPLAELYTKLIMNVQSGVGDEGLERSIWFYGSQGLCIVHASAACMACSLCLPSVGTEGWSESGVPIMDALPLSLSSSLLSVCFCMTRIRSCRQLRMWQDTKHYYSPSGLCWTKISIYHPQIIPSMILFPLNMYS